MVIKFIRSITKILKTKGDRKLSVTNEMLDQGTLKNAEPALKALHEELRSILKESQEKWPHYDYGMGYFYQSYPTLSIRGLRQTDVRFKFYDLDTRLKPETRVLDIGCNAGFLTLMIAKCCKQIDAFELNPFLIQIAEKCMEYEGIKNASFSCSDFDGFCNEQKKKGLDETYDIVLSLANHHTFDGQMRPEFRDYMEQIRGLMESGGMLIFESHPAEYETLDLKKNIEACSDIFTIEEEKVVSTKKSIYDSNRLVMWIRAV